MVNSPLPKDIILRCVLNSCGDLSAEAEITLVDGSRGIGSVPAAIRAGRREKSRSKLAAPGRFGSDLEIEQFLRLFQDEECATQNRFDLVLSQNPLCQDLGSDITLALSLAFARASAAARGQSFVQYLAALGDFQPHMPHPLVNIFSGGLHGHASTIPFQQIMLVPHTSTFAEDVTIALQLYQEIERSMKESGRLLKYSASSGMLVETHDYATLLVEIAEHIARLNYSSSVSIGLDIAAEHLLQSPGLYRFAGELMSADQLIDIYKGLLRTFDIEYLEDPFDLSDSEAWHRLNSELNDNIYLIGDDLFATNALYINGELANGILLKMKQAGTLSATIEAARTAQAHKMTLCVSHRSCETEDTAMCDLAVALGADLIKIGGPRRGDRIAKYNQLLRLAETWQQVQ